MTSAPARPHKRRATGAGMVAAVVVAAAVVVGGSEKPAAAAVADPVVSTAGDIACSSNDPNYNGGAGTAWNCRQRHTSDMILGADYVFVLGDQQYWRATLNQYQTVYDSTWGRKKSVTFPTPGDHEYQTPGATGYYGYFGVEPYYSFDIGSWHWVSLNSEIDHSAGSPQVAWLQQDLAATSKPCIGAFWSTPVFTSSYKGNNPTYRPFWDALYAVGADLVLVGDSHLYERFTKMSPDGTPTGDGIRQFVVGTGGKSLINFSTIKPTSEAHAAVFGVLDLRLGSSDYGWNFRTESGGSFSDSGNAACNP